MNFAQTAATFTALCVALVPASKTFAQTTSSSLSLAPNGRLIYNSANAQNDTIPDFSNCGYQGGGVALPTAPVRIVVAPDANALDDAPRIQAAIDAVSRLSSTKGLRGAVLLQRGRYKVGGTLKIAASGVVLRGEGQGEDGTVLVATLRRKHDLIEVKGVGIPLETPGTRQAIVDERIPVGARSFRVENGARFKVGDALMVHRPSTASWIAALGMDRIPASPAGNTVQWKPGSKDLKFERTITAISGNRITVDAPLTNALQREFGGGSVYRYSFAGRLSHVGIENLRGESEFDAAIVDPNRPNRFVDEAHGWNFIALNGIRDSWVRDVSSRYFAYSCVNIGQNARSVTVQDCQSLDPVSLVTGGRRYSFAISGQLNLVQRCYANFGRHDFVMGAVVAGPNVFLDCRAEKAFTDSGPHHRWATGTLYDNVQTDGPLNVQNRGNSGTGHGWAGSQMVFWNCRARSIDLQSPPTSQNYAIGCVAAKTSGDGFWESVNQPVAPRSLYLRQLGERLGSEAVQRISKRYRSS